MEKDFKFLEIVSASKGRQDAVDKMIRAAKYVESDWKNALESGDGIDINDMKPKLESSNGVIIRAILLDACQTLFDVGNYLDEKLVKFRDLSKPNVLRIGDESRERNLEYTIYPVQEISRIFEELPSIVKDYSEYVMKISSALKSFLSSEWDTEKVEDASRLCEEFVNFMNMDKMFKPNSYSDLAVDPTSDYAGNIVIAANKLLNEIRKYTEKGTSMAENFRIYSRKLAAPENLGSFADMKSECRQMFFVFCRCIRNITPATLSFASNFIKVMDMASTNYSSMKFAVENV